MSPVARRRERHSRRPTLSVIRDSRMFFDGENAEEEEMPPLEAPETKEPSAWASASEPAEGSEQGEPLTDAHCASAPSPSLAPEGSAGDEQRDDPEDRDRPPTPPPKSPSLGRHSRSASVLSGESTLPSLCSSSPTSRSVESADVHLPYRSPTRAQSPLPPLPHVHVDAADHARPTSPSGYPGLFAHHRHTQILMEDLIATMDYDYTNALEQLSPPMSGLTPSALHPIEDIEPGSSAGTIKHVVSPHARDSIISQHTYVFRQDSTSSGGSRWSTEASEDMHVQSPIEDPELTFEEALSTTISPSQSPTLSRTPSTSTVSSEYDFGDDEDGYYSYDVGAFRDPFGSPTTAQTRRVFGYGIPWPSTHRRTSEDSAGSGGSSSAHDVLSDLEDLAEDLTERFALSMKSPTTSVRSSSHSGDSDVFGAGGELTDAPEGDYSSRRSGRPSGGSSHGSHQYGSGGAHSGGHSGFDGSWNGRGGLMGRGGGGRDDEDSDDDRRRRPSRLPVNSRAIATDSEEDTDSDDSGTDDYGDESPSLAAFPRERRSTTRTLQPPASAPLPRAATSVHAEQVEDDVPLARQIPGALKAQRTIRRQVKDELDQKRAERRAKQAALQQHPAAEPRAPTSALEPAFPLLQQNSPSKLVGRPRTKTLPSNMNSPFTPGDLTKKLLGLQVGPGAAVPGVSPTSPALPPMPASPWGAATHSHAKQPSYDAREPLVSGRGRTMTVDAQAYSASLSRQPSRAAP